MNWNEVRSLEERGITYKGYENPQTTTEITLELAALRGVKAAVESRIASLQFLLLEKRFFGSESDGQERN